MSKPSFSLPSVSVADAMGIPSSPKSGADPFSQPAVAILPEDAPPEEPVETPETPEPELEPTPEPKPEPKPEPAPAAKKPSEAPKPATPAPAKKPAEGTKPAAKVPDAPPSSAPAPAKIKIAGKEYTEDELAKLLKKSEEPAQKSVPASEAPKQPKIAPKAPTPEEVAQQRQREQQLEKQFIDETSKRFNVGLDETTLQKIFEGGPNAVATLKDVIASASAQAVLEARKSMYEELNPIIAELRGQVEPLEQQFQRAENERLEGAIMRDFPTLKDFRDELHMVASIVAEDYRKQGIEPSEAEFLKRVGEETVAYIDRQRQKFGPAQPTTPETPAVERTAPAAPAKAPKVKVAPPAANAPVGKGVPKADAGWNKSVIDSLL